MIGHRFVNFIPGENSKSKFEQMLDIFTQLLNYTSGDASEALDWMNQLDRSHKFTDDQYGMGDFIEDLKKNGYLKENPQDGKFEITAKTEQTIRQHLTWPGLRNHVLACVQTCDVFMDTCQLRTRKRNHGRYFV
jgi:hypothetical protein